MRMPAGRGARAMHMADALISPAVGGSLWAVAAACVAGCARRVRQSAREDLVPTMGVLGAFVFAAQMINFTIPGTGSSGHLGGGLLLAVLLGPAAGFLVIASVLVVQALFFADGGLLALGCNIVNMGLFPAFVAYPLLYRSIAGGDRRSARAWAGALVAAVVGLQFGAFAVVLETTLSGLTDLRFGAFALLMQPIHLAIGIVEGLATAAIVAFVARARPESFAAEAPPAAGRRTLVAVAAAAVLIGGGLSWFASAHPDGLEWALARATGHEELAPGKDAAHAGAATLQQRTAIMPDYQVPGHAAAGPTAAGLLGGAITVGLVALAGWALRRPGRAAKGCGA